MSAIVKRRILISFSGGRTSAYMAKRLRDENPDADLLFIFANTGDEDDRTLDFVDRCDREWGLGVVWVEAEVSPERGQGTTHRVVTYETASRQQEPFRAVIEKYGIPNKGFNHCNRETKLRPIHSYARSIGWSAGTYDTAIGIRYDELDRKSPAAAKERWIYPMIVWKATKSDVVAWFRTQPFDLGVEEEFGNCQACHKKSLRKLLTVAKRRPEAFAWRTEMEAQHPFSGAGEGPRRFYRSGWTTLDILARARLPFEPFVDSNYRPDPEGLDLAGACGESCGIFTDEEPADDIELREWMLS